MAGKSTGKSAASVASMSDAVVALRSTVVLLSSWSARARHECCPTVESRTAES
jgi:hypothetical protein